MSRRTQSNSRRSVLQKRIAGHLEKINLFAAIDIGSASCCTQRTGISLYANFPASLRIMAEWLLSWVYNRGDGVNSTGFQLLKYSSLTDLLSGKRTTCEECCRTKIRCTGSVALALYGLQQT